jgi:PST family polysaccharide transporter
MDIAELKRKSIRGGAVTMASQAITIVIQLASTVVLARLLSPPDYGVIAMVTAITSFAGLFRDLGLSSAAIQKENLTAAQQSNLFWLNVAMGGLLTATVAAGAPLVVWFYAKPELYWPTVALSSSFLIGSLGSQHGAMQVRKMQFVRRAIVGIAGALVTLAVAVALALLDFSYWALVWSSLAGAATSTAFTFILSPFRPLLPSKGSGVRDMLRFGANITGFQLVNYFHRNLDNILIGRFWGSGMLGLYSRAYNLLLFPISAIRGPIEAVAFPAMSKLQHEPRAFRAYYRRITFLLALASMPLTTFLFVASAPIIKLALGTEWLAAAPIFSILALTAFIQPVAGLRGLVLLSTQQGRRYFHWGIFNAICVSFGFLCGIPWGPIGVATAYAIVNYIILYPSILLAFRHTSLTPRDFFAPIALPSAACIVAAGACKGVELTGAISTLPAFALLVVQGLIVGAAFLASMASSSAGRSELIKLPSLIAALRPKRA